MKFCPLRDITQGFIDCDNCSHIYDQKKESNMTTTATETPAYNHPDYSFVYAIFFTNTGKKGYACFAFTRAEKGNKIYFGESFCNPHDGQAFSKSEAKKGAVRRLETQGKSIEVHALLNDCISYTKIVKTFFENKRGPSWTHKNNYSISLSLDWMTGKQFNKLQAMKKFAKLTAKEEEKATIDRYSWRQFCHLYGITPETALEFFS